jgi:3-methyladenine DNA glycosylase AlkD
MDVQAVIGQLRERADPSRKPGMARVGIDVSQALGVSMPNIRAIAKACGVDHTLALGLGGRRGSTKRASSPRWWPIPRR